MKSYNGLWDKMMTKENIVDSIQNAHRGKGKKLRKKRYRLLVHIYVHREDDKVIDMVRGWIENYQNVYREPTLITDGSSGKVREIYAPTVVELVVQHCVVNVLKDILIPMINANVYGSVPGKGSQDAIKYMMDFIRKHPRQCKYCCKMDHKKYFKSIPQHKLMQKLKRKIRDSKFYALVCIIIMYIPIMRGLPIGFYTSQLLGVWYLYDSDEYVNQTLKHEGVALAVRWMDDVYFFGPNKRMLDHCMYSYIAFTRCNQDLAIKDNYQVFRFSHLGKHKKDLGRFLDAMGYRLYCNRVTLRKSIMIRMTRKARELYKKHQNGQAITIKDCRSMLSYNGYLKVTKTYGVYLQYIKPNVSYKACKTKISKFDRRRIQNERMDSCKRNAVRAA